MLNSKGLGVTPRRLAAALVAALPLYGCESMSNTEKGVLAGGGIGAATGALIGGATKHAGAGALIGTGVGAVAGGLTGHAIDESEHKQQARQAAQAARGQMTIGEVVKLTQQHVSDDIIINQIRAAGTVINLTADDIAMLKENGVSDNVVRELQATVYRMAPRRLYTAAPVMVVEPPPPVAVGIGVGFRSR